MKKSLVVTIAALTVVFTLSPASVYAQGLIGIGVKAGLNLDNVWGDDVKDIYAAWEEDLGAEIDKKMKTGASFGAFLNYSINNIFAIQPELLYTMKGVKGEADVTMYDSFFDEYYTMNFEITVSLNYLEIPVLAKVSIPTEGSVKPVLLIGPALAIKTSAEMEVKAEYMGLSGSVEEDISDDIKSIDFGLVFGAGMDVGLGSGKASLDARYNLGLNSIDDTASDLDIKNSVISIMIGYCFPL